MTSDITVSTGVQTTPPFAFGGPVCEAKFKQFPHDFVVIERLPFAADGEGPHWLVEIEKTDMNTLDLLDALSRHLKIPRRSVGYSGLKDRFAMTRQFVTVPANNLPEDTVRESADTHWKVIGVTAHRRKLRVGSHRQNAFEITLRDIPDDDKIRKDLELKLDQIDRTGAPNYFGPQRFGNDGANLRKATQFFDGTRKLPRQQHRFAVSAARSFVYNAVVARRVKDGTWNTLLDGEAVSLDGNSSWFDYAKLDDNFQTRLDEFDIHPSGPMWGTGKSPATGEARRVELDAIASLELYTKGLEQLGLKQERRALRQRVSDLTWNFEDDTLTLGFALNKGCFATSVLRELVSCPELLLRG